MGKRKKYDIGKLRNKRDFVQALGNNVLHVGTEGDRS